MRLFIISICTLICVFLVLIITRLWGLSLPTYKFEHRFYEFQSTTRPLLIRVFHSINEIKSELATTPELIIWLSTYVTNDHHFIVDSQGNLNDLILALNTQVKGVNSQKNSTSSPSLVYKGRYLHNYSLNEIKSLKQDILTLEEILTVFSKNKFIISIKNNAPNIHKDFISLVQKLNLENQILIQSDYDIVLKSIKEEKPLYTFATSISEVMRLKTFSTIYLEPAVSMKGDTFIATLEYKNRPLVTPEIIAEMKRRQKYVFLGPLTSQEEIDTAKKFNPDGLIFD